MNIQILNIIIIAVAKVKFFHLHLLLYSSDLTRPRFHTNSLASTLLTKLNFLICKYLKTMELRLKRRPILEAGFHLRKKILLFYRSIK